MNKQELGKRLREARKMKGYSQQALAQMAGIGHVYISEMERGQKMPSIDVFIRIIKALDVSADYILRNALNTGRDYVLDELTEKLKDLTPRQRKTAAEILDAYISNLK